MPKSKEFPDSIDFQENYGLDSSEISLTRENSAATKIQAGYKAVKARKQSQDISSKKVPLSIDDAEHDDAQPTEVAAKHADVDAKHFDVDAKHADVDA